MSRFVKFGGNDTPLGGNEVKIGDNAPDFIVLDTDMNEVKLSDYKGQNVVITAFPSVDTSVCSTQAHKFNDIATKLGDDVQIITVSADLPFALGRYCAAEGLNNIITTSDHKLLDFANNYGFLLEDMRLLERGIVVIDSDGIIRHVEYVDEVTNEPDYDSAMDVLKSL